MCREYGVERIEADDVAVVIGIVSMHHTVRALEVLLLELLRRERVQRQGRDLGHGLVPAMKTAAFSRGRRSCNALKKREDLRAVGVAAVLLAVDGIPDVDVRLAVGIASVVFAAARLQKEG